MLPENGACEWSFVPCVMSESCGVNCYCVLYVRVCSHRLDVSGNKCFERRKRGRGISEVHAHDTCQNRIRFAARFCSVAGLSLVLRNSEFRSLDSGA